MNNLLISLYKWMAEWGKNEWQKIKHCLKTQGTVESCDHPHPEQT